MTTICGHDREALLWILADFIPAKKRCVCNSCTIKRDLDDPIKLASIISAALAHEPWFLDCVADDDSLVFAYRVPNDAAHRTVDMPEARRILLAILEDAADKLAVVRGDK